MSIYKSFKGQPWKSNEEELNKLIDSEMLAGSNYICFDNVRGYLGSQTLEGLMTTPEHTGRVLGKTQMFTAKNCMTLFVTGNECIISPDMTHRCLICNLFVEQGDVQERQVENLLDEPWLLDLENRRCILSALWGIVRSWADAGRPTGSSFGFKPRLGFEKWGELFGGLVGHAGFGNPLEKVALEDSGDQQKQYEIGLLLALNEEREHPKSPICLPGMQEREFEFQDLVNICHENEFFPAGLKGRRDGENWRLDNGSKLGLSIKKIFPPNNSGCQKRHECTIGNLKIASFATGLNRMKRWVLRVKETA